jgi:hypothetical protein
MNFSKIELMQFSKQRGIQCYAVQFSATLSKLRLIAIYRPLSGDFDIHLNELDSILTFLYRPKAEFITSEDVNID